jgi:hypothetical protein
MSDLAKSRLEQLADEINSEHGKFRAAFKVTLGHALRAGLLLTEAKSEVGHGNWSGWVAQNCEFSMRTAQVYIRIASNRERVEEMLKSAGPAHLSIEGVLRELAAPVSNIPARERVILERAREMVDAGHHISALTPNMEGMERDSDERRRGFVAETAWAALMCSVRDYIHARAPLDDALEYDPSAITPEMLTEITPNIQEAVDAIRWWVGECEWIEAQVRACDWPPGRNMLRAAFDEERKHLLLPELYADDDEYVRYWNDEDYELPGIDEGRGLPSPRADVRARCGLVV